VLVDVPEDGPVALRVVFALEADELFAQLGDSLLLVLEALAGGLALLEDELDEPGLGELL